MQIFLHNCYFDTKTYMVSILTGIVRSDLSTMSGVRFGYLSIKHFHVKKKTDQWRPLQRKLVLQNTSTNILLT